MLFDGPIPDFMWRALLAGVGVAILTGPLGCIVVWRRMAYFGEAMAHSALLGVVLGAVLGTLPWATIVIVCSLVASLLYLLEQRGIATMDAAIGIVAHGALAIGLVLMSQNEALRIDLFSYLFGDILAVSTHDLWIIVIGGIVVSFVLAMIWSPLLSVIINPDVAKVEGVQVARTKIAFLILLALTVAAAMKILGVLLVVAMLVIPASGARAICQSPESMALAAAIIGILGVVLGLGGGYQFDTPTGPSIVTAVVSLFVLLAVSGRMLKKRV